MSTNTSNVQDISKRLGNGRVSFSWLTDNTNVSYLSLKIDDVPDVARIYHGVKIPFGFGIDANGNYGYIKRGADTVIPFKSAPSSVIVATLIGGRYADGSSNSSHAITTDNTVFTATSVSESLSGGRLTALKSCSGKLFLVGAQRGPEASATVKINGTTYVSGSAYTNGYKGDISLSPNDYITISLSKPDTTYAAFGCVLLVTLN